MRLFLAIPCPADLQARLLGWRPQGDPQLRWVPAEQLHITLHFVGEAEPNKIETALTGIEFERFTLSITGVGSFKGGRHQHMLWAGVEPSQSLSALHQRIGEHLINAGIELKPHHYHPHITLARAKALYPREKLNVFLQQKTTIDTFSVVYFSLYQSDLSSGKPVYTELARFESLVR